MNTPYITAILAITSLAFSVGTMAEEGMSKNDYKAANSVDAMAEGMSKSDYKAAKKNITD